MPPLKVKGKSKTIRIFQPGKDGKIGVVNVGEAIQDWINNELRPQDRIIALHVTEVPDPAVSLGGIQGKKAMVTVIYQ